MTGRPGGVGGVRPPRTGLTTAGTAGGSAWPPFRIIGRKHPSLLRARASIKIGAGRRFP